MRSLAVGLAVVVLAASPRLVRAEDTAVRDLLDRALKAQGGADKAARASDMSLKGKAQVNEGGQTAEFSFDMSIRAYDRLRMELTISVAGMVNTVTLVVADGKGWARNPGADKVDEAPADAVPLLQSFMLAIRGPGSPAMLAGRKDLTLAHGGEAKVDDTPAEVLRISRKDRPDVTIYFDKKTGLPLKSEAQLKEPNEGQERAYTFQFSEFKQFEGVTHFTKVKIARDGKDLVELELSDLKPGAKFEANTFDKP